jgi:hypothetical protein
MLYLCPLRETSGATWVLPVPELVATVLLVFQQCAAQRLLNLALAAHGLLPAVEPHGPDRIQRPKATSWRDIKSGNAVTEQMLPAKETNQHRTNDGMGAFCFAAGAQRQIS